MQHSLDKLLRQRDELFLDFGLDEGERVDISRRIAQIDCRIAEIRLELESNISHDWPQVTTHNK